jgi:hypothetical protein
MNHKGVVTIKISLKNKFFRMKYTLTAWPSLVMLIMASGCALKLPFQGEEKSISRGPCESRPTVELRGEDLELTTLTSELTTLTPFLNPGQHLGYMFDAQAGQKLTLIAEEACLWIFSPSVEILTDSQLPEDGKYIIQMRRIQGSGNTEIQLGIDIEPDPVPVANARSSETPNGILTVNTDCPLLPKMVLNDDNIQPVNITSEIQIYTPSTSSDKAIGYLFSGQAGQRLTYDADNACIWVFTPMMDIMTDNILPEDGQYIIQIEQISNNQSIQVELGLDVVDQVIDEQEELNNDTLSWDFPMQECGDSNPSGLQTFYPVFINQTDEDILNHIKSNYCQDAFLTLRDDDETRSIQVASFRDLEKARSFIGTLRQDTLVDTVEIGSERQL